MGKLQLAADYPERTLTFSRIVLAVVVGAFLGGAFSGFDYGWGLYRSDNPSHGGDYFLKCCLQNSLSIGAFASVFWLIGLTFIAGPLWGFLHDRGKREFWHAMLLGFGLMSIIYFGLLTGGFDGRSNTTIGLKVGQVWHWRDGQLTADGWTQAFRSSGMLGILGGMIGVVIWRISYRIER